MPCNLRDNPTTRTGMHYDQIAFKTRPEVIEYVDSRSRDPLKQNAGVVNLFEKVLILTRHLRQSPTQPIPGKAPEPTTSPEKKSAGGLILP